MKKLLVSLGILFLLFYTSSTLSGIAVGQSDPLITPNPVTQPNSRAYGQSLDAWVESYLRWAFEGAELPDGNVTFLPIFGEVGVPFEVTVKPGTSMLLPVVLWIGFPGDPELGVSNFSGNVLLDGQEIVEPNEDYYAGVTYLDPYIPYGEDDLAFYEGLVVMINPLKPGVHVIELNSSLTIPDFGTFNYQNTWYITVAP